MKRERVEGGFIIRGHALIVCVSHRISLRELYDLVNTLINFHPVFQIVNHYQMGMKCDKQIKTKIQTGLKIKKRQHGRRQN